MITSKQDAEGALDTLFGTTKPCIADVSTRELDFIEGFINPVIVASEKKVILGYAYIPQKENNHLVVNESLPLVVARPTHVLPTGHAIVYHRLPHYVICGVCATKNDEDINSWWVDWDNKEHSCDDCGQGIDRLSMMGDL